MSWLVFTCTSSLIVGRYTNVYTEQHVYNMYTIYHTQTLPTWHIPKLHSFNFDKSSVQFFSSRNFSSAVEIFLLPASVTRWLDYLFNFWPFTSMKVYDYTYNICQSRLILYQPSKWSRSFKSGKVSQNLVTLTPQKVSKCNKIVILTSC